MSRHSAGRRRALERELGTTNADRVNATRAALLPRATSHLETEPRAAAAGRTEARAGRCCLSNDEGGVANGAAGTCMKAPAARCCCCARQERGGGARVLGARRGGIGLALVLFREARGEGATTWWWWSRASERCCSLAPVRACVVVRASNRAMVVTSGRDRSLLLCGVCVGREMGGARSCLLLEVERERGRVSRRLCRQHVPRACSSDAPSSSDNAKTHTHTSTLSNERTRPPPLSRSPPQ